MTCFVGTSYAKSPYACKFYHEFSILEHSKFQNTEIALQITLNSEGTYGVSVNNLTNEYIYLDLGRTYLILNGSPTAYYIPTSTTTTTSSTTGAAVNVGAIAGAMGVSGSLGRALNGVNVGGANTTGSSTVVYSQRVVAVPPLTTYTLEAHKINMDPTITTGIKYFNPVNYSEFNSPVKIETSVAYSKEEGCREINTLRGGIFLKKTIGLKTTGGMAMTFGNKAQAKLSEFYPGWDTKIYMISENCQKSHALSWTGLWAAAFVVLGGSIVVLALGGGV
jgi:hypothetical protein